MEYLSVANTPVIVVPRTALALVSSTMRYLQYDVMLHNLLNPSINKATGYLQALIHGLWPIINARKNMTMNIKNMCKHHRATPFRASPKNSGYRQLGPLRQKGLQRTRYLPEASSQSQPIHETKTQKSHRKKLLIQEF